MCETMAMKRVKYAAVVKEKMKCSSCISRFWTSSAVDETADNTTQKTMATERDRCTVRTKGFCRPKQGIVPASGEKILTALVYSIEL